MTQTDKSAESGEWLIHKAGRGWYRPNAEGYTNNPAKAGRYSYAEAMSYSHPNGWDGPRDEITIKRVSEVISAAKDAEPVAWRWRPKGSEVWVYNPEPEWLGRQSRDEIDAEPIYTHPQEAESLRVEVDRLTDDLGFSRAETAMAFEVAAQRCEFRDHAESEAESEFDRGYDQACDECAAIVRTLAPADATAAIAARDKAKDDRISELEAELNRALAQIESLDAECDRRHAALEQMQAERDAALAGAVKVRPLVWEDHQGRGAKAAAFGRCNYLISQRRDGTFEACESYPGYGGPWIGGVFYPTLEAAKTAAQADYTARILAAIQPDTEAVEMAEAAAFSAGFEAGERSEREACAVLIEARDGSIPYRQEIAAAIRKRGED